MTAPLLLALAPQLSPVLQDDAAELVFTEGDLAALSVRIDSVEELLDGSLGTLALVEVRNPGELAAEPLCFEARLAEPDPALPGPLRCRRVDPSWYGRAGRPVPAGGKQEYPLIVPLRPENARSLELRVVEASSFTGEVAEGAEPSVEVLDFEVVSAFDPELQRRT